MECKHNVARLSMGSVAFSCTALTESLHPSHCRSMSLVVGAAPMCSSTRV